MPLKDGISMQSILSYSNLPYTDQLYCQINRFQFFSVTVYRQYVSYLSMSIKRLFGQSL